MVSSRRIEIVAVMKDYVSKTLKPLIGRFAGASKGVRSFMAALTGIGALAGGIFLLGKAVRGIVRTFVDATKRASDLQTSSAKLNAILKSTGAGAGVTTASLRAMEDQLFATTTQSRAMIRDAEGLLLTFTSIGGEVFPGALEAAADMSAVFGQDLRQSMIQLGVALNDPERGLSRLRRIGVSFSAEQEKVIDALAATGDLAGAQKEILRELNLEFGGAAKAAMSTFRGALVNVNKQWTEWKEKIGDVVIRSEGLRDFLVDVGTLLRDFAKDVSPEDVLGVVGKILAAVGAVLRSIASIFFWVTKLKFVFQKFFGGFILGLGLIQRGFQTVANMTSKGIGVAMERVGSLLNLIGGGFTFLADFLSNIFGKIAGKIEFAFLKVKEAVLHSLLSVVIQTGPLLSKIGIDSSEMFNLLSGGLADVSGELDLNEAAMAGFSQSVQFQMGTAGDTMVEYGNALIEVSDESMDAINSEVNSLEALGDAWLTTSDAFFNSQDQVSEFIRLIDDLGLSALEAAKNMGLIPDTIPTTTTTTQTTTTTTPDVTDAGEDIAKAFGAEFRLSLASALGEAVAGGGDIGQVFAQSIGAELSRSIAAAQGGVFGGISSALGAGATAFLGPVVGGLATSLLGGLFSKKKKVKPQVQPVRVVNFEDLTGELLRASSRRRVGPPQINGSGQAGLSMAFSGEARV